MNIYESKSIKEYIAGNPYVGRGIIIGRTPDAKKANISGLRRCPCSEFDSLPKLHAPPHTGKELSIKIIKVKNGL